MAPVRPAPPPTPAGSSTPPSTSWPAGARAVIWPAPGRPLPPGGGLAGRPGRDQSGGHRRLRQGRGRPGRAPGARAADNGAAPGPSRRPVTGRLVEHVRSLGVEPPAGRPYRPTTHGRQRALPPDPAPPPGPAAPGRLHRRAPGAGRPLRPHLQHPAPPPGPARAHHPAAGLGRHRGGPGTPTGPRHRPHHPRRPNPRATRPPGADRRTGAGPSPPAASAKPAITRNGTVHIGGIAFLVRRALAGHRTTAIRDATTITFADVHGEVLIQYNWPPEGVTRVSHHPPDPTNQRGGRGRRRPQPSPKS